MTFSVFSSSLFSATPFCFLCHHYPVLRSCVGFHSVLSSFQPSFVKEKKSVREISIALLLFQEGYGIQVCLYGCPFLSGFPFFIVFLYFCGEQCDWGAALLTIAWLKSQPLCCMKQLCFQTTVEWVTFVLETMLSVFLLFLLLHPSRCSFVDVCALVCPYSVCASSYTMILKIDW